MKNLPDNWGSIVTPIRELITEKCDTCGGDGIIQAREVIPYVWDIIPIPCPECNGTGKKNQMITKILEILEKHSFYCQLPVDYIDIITSNDFESVAEEIDKLYNNGKI